ncbi:MAG: hypothetical protein JW768_15590 [Chitinispirillaceae bacterium]|nr:hypothetical protein [Chitinispirillaceae bacterium]
MNGYYHKRNTGKTSHPPSANVEMQNHPVQAPLQLWQREIINSFYYFLSCAAQLEPLFTISRVAARIQNIFLPLPELYQAKRNLFTLRNFWKSGTGRLFALCSFGKGQKQIFLPSAAFGNQEPPVFLPSATLVMVKNKSFCPLQLLEIRNRPSFCPLQLW